MKIRILPEAEYDLELGADFYESQREGLGRYFNDCLMADIESLRIYAGVHGRVYDLFRSLSKRFPFAIFYDISRVRFASDAGGKHCRNERKSLRSSHH